MGVTRRDLKNRLKNRYSRLDIYIQKEGRKPKAPFPLKINPKIVVKQKRGGRLPSPLGSQPSISASRASVSASISVISTTVALA